MTDLTPWARSWATAAGLTASDLALPEGWHLIGSARSSGGPVTFRLVNRDPAVAPFKREVTVYRVSEVRDAIAGLVASVTPDLEMQLAASLALIEGGHK